MREHPFGIPCLWHLRLKSVGEIVQRLNKYLHWRLMSLAAFTLALAHAFQCDHSLFDLHVSPCISYVYRILWRWKQINECTCPCRNTLLHSPWKSTVAFTTRRFKFKCKMLCMFILPTDCCTLSVSINLIKSRWRLQFIITECVNNDGKTIIFRRLKTD